MKKQIRIEGGPHDGTDIEIPKQSHLVRLPYVDIKAMSMDEAIQNAGEASRFLRLQTYKSIYQYDEGREVFRPTSDT